MTSLVYGTTWSRINPLPCVVVGTTNLTSALPTEFKLHDNYPNPFNPATVIKYDLPKSSHVKITVYDILGKEVGILVNQDKTAGFYEIKWDARNYASGAYFYKMETDSYTEIKKMMENGPSEADLQKAKEYFLKQRQEDMKENSWWMSRMDDYYFYNLDFLTGYDNKVKALNIQSVHDYAKKVLTQGNVVQVVMRP